MSGTINVSFALLFGLTLGSFANVLVARVPLGESINGRSHCPDCGSTLAVWDLIPVLSWIRLSGRCRSCDSKISIRYPIIESLTAIFILFTTLREQSVWSLIAWIGFTTLAVALSVIDLKYFRLPNPLVLSALLWGLLFLAAASFSSGDWHAYLRALICAFALFAFFLFLRTASRGGMGLGDVKLAAVTGFFLGYASVRDLLVGTFTAFLLGAVVGILLMAMQRAGHKTPIPFGPFMLVGAWLAYWLTPIVYRLLLQG